MSLTDSQLEDLPLDEISTYCEEEEQDLGYEEPFRYRTEDFISRPWMSKRCNIDENVLEFDYSYGYDCKKPYNLVLIDEHTIIFASGNLIHFFDVDTREVWFRRSAFGGGIGHIAKNPNNNYAHVAIGENGKNPPIIIYEWPSLEIVCLLKGGTTRRFTHLNYSPEGDLLVSQGGEPDYLITIFEWRKSTILLRTKSYVNDVLRVMFSPEVPGQLTSCGVAHIKFWKMASTFTGLKLQGELGRFGKTEYSDIVGIYPMADEKVISGCYWGNILVWEEGLIKIEVTRKGRQPCHEAPIVQFDYKNGELWTVSMDGHVRVWYYDTIDQADPPDEDRVVQMEPTYDFHTPGAEFMSIQKQFEDPENTFYFAQDGKGGIWRIDLTIESDAVESERLLKCHAGIATALAVCPWGPYFNTLGIGGRLHLYNYIDRELLVIYRFPAKGLCLIWIPLDVDPSGEVIIAACDDGALRVGVWKINSKEPKKSKLSIIQITKPHNKPVTAISLNSSGTILITGGEDSTIYIFQVIVPEKMYLQLIPIGYLNTPDIVSCLTWHNTIDNFIIVGCLHGFVMTAEVPRSPVSYTTITYILKNETKVQRFYTYKSQILQDRLIVEINKRTAARMAVKWAELQRVRMENPGLEIDEDIYLVDSASEEKLEPLFIPEEPNRVLWIQHTEDDTLWLSMGGYDAGFIYEYEFGQTDEVPHRFTSVHEGEDIELCNFVYSANGEYQIFATQDGSIRVCKVNPEDWRDLSNFWQLAMHNNFNGFVAGLAFSYDESYFITCGHDGNVFTFRFFPEYSSSSSETSTTIARDIPDERILEEITIPECDQYGVLSLEETIVKKEVDRINMVANNNKAAYLKQLSHLREIFEQLVERNAALPASQRLPDVGAKMDPRVNAHLQMKHDADLALVKRKLAFDVEKSEIGMMKLKNHFIDNMDMFPINVKCVWAPTVTRPISMRKMDKNFDVLLQTVDIKIAEQELKGRPPERAPPAQHKIIAPPPKERKLEYFLAGLPKRVIQKHLGAKIDRLLAKYRLRKERREQRHHEWAVFNSQKPSDASTDADDNAVLKKAQDETGDYKLKSADDYTVPHSQRDTTYKKYKELLLARRRQFNLAHKFNEGVYRLRDKKKYLHDFLIEHTAILKACHEEILPKERQYGPEIFEFGDADYPDKMFLVNVDMLTEETIKPKTKRLVETEPCRDTMESEILLNLSDPDECNVESVWEEDVRSERRIKKLFEQAEIIKHMEAEINSFDDHVKQWRFKRTYTLVDYDLLTLHMLTCNQEMMILKECETTEDLLSESVHNKMVEMLDIEDVHTNLKHEIVICTKEIEKLHEQVLELQKIFLNATAENKFYDFLRRIFKKKYRPPKVKTDSDSDSDSSSSSSESEEDEDAGSVDSKDFGIIRLDENVCPKGCDQNIYDFTFQLRGQRHVVELNLKDQNTLLETLKKDLDAAMKKKRVIDMNLVRCQEELAIFQRAKQNKINQIYCTVILNLNQFQHLTAETRMNMIKDSLVFSQPKLTSLYARVGELAKETQQQKAKHALSVKHLGRMKKDYNSMCGTITCLKKSIHERMVIKFGSRVKIEELEEFMLKQLIYHLKLSLVDFKSMFADESRYWYEQHKEKQMELGRAFKHNTVMVELMTNLRLEKSEFQKLLSHQDVTRSKMVTLLDQIEKQKNELKKLEKVVKQQEMEKEALLREIKIFRTKGFVRKEIEVHEAAVETEEDAYSAVSEWDFLDDYMYTETYAKEYWATKAVREALKTRQDIIMSIMDDLFQNVSKKLDRHMVVNLLKTVISQVLDKRDIEDILSEILRAVPGPLTDDEQSLIELTAEKLCCIELCDDCDYKFCSKEILLHIVDEVIEKNIDDPNEAISKLVSTLLESLPLHVILDDENINVIADHLKNSSTDLTQINLVEMLKTHVDMKTLEARTVLSEIIDRVCGIEHEQAHFIF